MNVENPIILGSSLVALLCIAVVVHMVALNRKRLLVTRKKKKMNLFLFQRQNPLFL